VTVWKTEIVSDDNTVPTLENAHLLLRILPKFNARYGKPDVDLGLNVSTGT
jgi:hypothetical protein